MAEITSYKNNSRIITLIAAIITALAALTVDTWQGIIPQEYWGVIPFVIAILGYVAAQLSEEKRVTVAEELVHQEYQTETSDEAEA